MFRYPLLARPSFLRVGAFVALTALVISACGSSSGDDDDDESGGESGAPSGSGGASAGRGGKGGSGGKGGTGGTSQSGEGGNAEGATGGSVSSGGASGGSGAKGGSAGNGGTSGGSGGSGNSDTGGAGAGGEGAYEDPEPTPTDIGTPIGTAESATIGPEGGSLSSSDGRVELIIPAGALGEDTELTIQPVTNTAHGGVGDGYDFLPDGQTFEKPVEIVLHYTDEDELGTAPEFLTWAFQDEEELWVIVETTADTASTTLTAETTHFTVFSPLSKLRVLPKFDQVQVEGFLGFKIEYCVELAHREGKEWVNAFECQRPGWFIHSHLGMWSVNGIPGGNSELGTVGGSFPEQMSYEAPAEVPSPDTVTLSIGVTDLYGKKAAPLTAKVRVLPRGLPYRGDFSFVQAPETTRFEGTAHLVWLPTSIAPDVEQYDASGTVDATLTYDDCDPVTTTLPITDGVLTYYTELNSGFPNQHAFNVAATKDVTLSCGEPRMAFSTTVGISIQAGFCTAPPFAPVTDREELTGTFTCPEASITSSSWSFLHDSPP